MEPVGRDPKCSQRPRYRPTEQYSAAGLAHGCGGLYAVAPLTGQPEKSRHRGIEAADQFPVVHEGAQAGPGPSGAPDLHGGCLLDPVDARRNIDLVMLTTDIEQVKNRIEKERYLPLDGMLTQSGDVWMKVTNLGDKPLTFQGKNAMGGGNWQQHSPYWVHLRNWPKIALTVPAGKSSSWTQVGHTMDSLNDGQWFWTGNQKYRVEFGLKTGPNPGQIERIGQFEGLGDLILAADADTRYSRRLRRQEDVLLDLVKHLTSDYVRNKLGT